MRQKTQNLGAEISIRPELDTSDTTTIGLPEKVEVRKSAILFSSEALLVQLEHGESEIDNNLIENAIRPSAVGKKNFLFIGSPEAGQRSAVIYSIIVSCERHGIDPLAYMTDALEKIPTMSNQDDYSALLPSNWKETR